MDIGVRKPGTGVKPTRRTDTSLPEDLRYRLMQTHSISEFRLRGLCDDLDEIAAGWIQADREVMYRPDSAANAVLKAADVFLGKLETLNKSSLDTIAPLLRRLALDPAEMDRGDIERLRHDLKGLRTNRLPKPDRVAATVAAADSLLESWFTHTKSRPTKATTDPTSAYRFYQSVIPHMKVGPPRTMFDRNPGYFLPSEIRAFQLAFDGEFERAVRRRPSET